MKLKLIIVLCLAMSMFCAKAQKMGLRVGDRLPDFAIDKVINSDGKTIRTSDFREKLLIVDFWATNCSGCIVALPKMEALQKQFGNKLAILPVTYEAQTKVSTFWKSNGYTKNLSLPSVVEDKKFSLLFKHRSIPHEAWIYKGIVIAITTSEYVDAHNIDLVLSGNKVSWPVKNDFYAFDGNKEPLFKLDPQQVDTSLNSIRYAAISDYKSGVNAEGLSGGSGIVRDRVKRTVRTFFLNQPIFTSYQLLMGKIYNVENSPLIKPLRFGINPNEVRWEVQDRSRYLRQNGTAYEQDWLRDNAICFESLNPDTGQTDIDVHKTTVAELNRLLGLNVRWEKQLEKVLILSRIRNTEPTASTKVAGNLSIKSIASMMNGQQANPYVFTDKLDSENKKYAINIKDWTDIADIRKVIAQFGFELREEERLVDKLVFSEVDGGLLVDRKMQVAAMKKRKAQESMTNPTPEQNAVFLQMNKAKPGVMTLPSGLQYKVLKVGTGDKPSVNDRVAVNFTGTLVNGKIFDSSMESGRPFPTAVKDVIPGWQQILPLMNVGSKWIIYAPAELAYGTHTNQGRIPPNSVLIFEMELLSILK